MEPSEIQTLNEVLKPLPERRQMALVEHSIYTVYDLSEIENDERLARFFYESGSVDGYCVTCKCLSVFRISGKTYGFEEEAKKLPRQRGQFWGTL